jgi:hypothetical protein
MKNLLPKRVSLFGLIGVILSFPVISNEALSNPVDTLSLPLKFACPLNVVDLKLVDFDDDGISEILVGFNSDSARAGVLDPVTQTWVWQSPGFGGEIYTVAVGDRNEDGFLDIVCGGQHSDSSIGYIKIFDGPDFDSVCTLSGFDEKVLSTAVSARGLDSLPRIFVGTYFDHDSCYEYVYGMDCKGIESGRLYVLDGKNLAIEDISTVGAVREILVQDMNADTHGQLFLGMDYLSMYESPLPIDFTEMHSWITESASDYSHDFNLYNIWMQGGGLTWVDFDALKVGEFNGGVSNFIVGSGRLAWWTSRKNQLACWNESTTDLEWSIEWDFGWYAHNYVTDLAVCSFSGEETDAICAAYRNGLIELKSAFDGSNLSISPLLHSIYHLEAGNVDQDNFIEICVTSADSLYVYETEFITTDVDEIKDHFSLEDFCLFQNYPNPFNPETKIRFTIPATSEVTLKIYNILGKEVRTFEKRYKAGSHTLTWDGKNSSGEDVASGVYLYKLSAGNHRETRKMVLLR